MIKFLLNFLFSAFFFHLKTYDPEFAKSQMVWLNLKGKATLGLECAYTNIQNKRRWNRSHCSDCEDNIKINKEEQNEKNKSMLFVFL